MKLRENKRNKSGRTLITILTATILLVLLIQSQELNAQPTGIDITSNYTEIGNATNPANRTDLGGTITTLNVDVLQRAGNWKAYVGNISGTLALDDEQGRSIYRWALESGDLTGNIFISRNNEVNWNNITCATREELEGEDTDLNITAGVSYNINSTFSDTYPSITVNLGAKTNCPATNTYVNNTQQNFAEANFPVIVLSSDSNIVFATPINKEKYSFRGSGDLVDFQAIVPNEAGQATAYYFYAELG